MSEPSFMRKVERNQVDVESSVRVLSELEENGPMYPWTLISRLNDGNEDHDSLRVNVLKPLVLKGYISPNADGELCIDDRRDFYADYVIQ